MSTQKDFTVNENQDRGAEKRQGKTEERNFAGDASSSKDRLAETEVKNAHATGDGSYGRSDESLPEEEEEGKEPGDTVSY